ncbi:MAG: hypothetical protein HY293_03620 [Planctomycetes bacterium]|nr:hypothetical protein [Planctomycetota bacterium]
MPDRRLRIGLLLDGFTLPAWVAGIVRAILTDPRLCVELVLLNASEDRPVRRSLPQKLWKNNFLYNRYVTWERRRVASQGLGAPEQDVSALLAGIPLLKAKPRGKKFVHRFSRRTIARIESRRLDILLRFGFKILKGRILQAAAFGVWSYHHGDNDFYRGGPAGFWEVYERNPVTGLTLQVLTEELDGGIVLGKSLLQTDFSSPVRNQAHLQAACQRVFDDAVAAVFRHSAQRESFFSEFKPSARAYERKLYTTPSNSQMMFFILGRLMPRFVRSRLQPRQQREQWFVGTGSARGVAPWDPSSGTPEIHWSVPEPARFIADPFPAKFDGRTVVFLEDFDYRKNKGVISAADLGSDGSLGPSVPVLEREFHLSFPFVLHHEGRLLMLPEQSRTRSLVFYECMRFPDQWKEAAKIFDGVSLVDSVVHSHEGRFWLFTTKPYEVEHHNNLYLFHSRTLFDGWVSHPLNPIRSSLRGARMAGSILRQGERLIRPGQNCVGGYGRSIVFFEIVRMNEREYEERELRGFLPLDGVEGNSKIHTINILEDLLVVDGSRMIQAP